MTKNDFFGYFEKTKEPSPPKLENLDGSDISNADKEAAASKSAGGRTLNTVSKSNTTYGSDNKDAEMRRNAFFSAAFNEKELIEAERGEKLVKIIALVIAVLTIIDFIFMIKKPSVAMVGFGLRSVGVIRFFRCDFGWRTYLGIIMAISAAEYFFIMLNTRIINALFGYVSAYTNIIQLFCCVMGLAFAVMTYFIFFHKSICAFFKNCD